MSLMLIISLTCQESFYSKLKAVADDGNTNLYVSNLPKAMNEHVRRSSPG